MTLRQLSSTVSHEPSIRQTRIGSLDAVVFDNGSLRLTVVPELGGKVVSLIRKQSGHEYLLQPLDPERAYRRRYYGDKFEDYEPSGFDECAPTIAECPYPEEPFFASRLPDHGDICCLPSGVEIVGEQVRLTSSIRSLPLRFTKKIQLQENIVRLEYEVTNLSQSGVKFLWSAHPLLRVEPGAEIILPHEVKEVEVGWSRDNRLGKSRDRCPWPRATECSGRMVELNRVGSPSAGTAEKLFTPRLSEGFCGMSLPRQNESIAFRFDPRLIPYVGIWVCQGGWPMSPAAKHFTVALEPCSGRPDSLEEAIRRNECVTLAAYGTMRWWMEIEVNGGAPRSQRMWK
jgi:galactose mutarotase-like enzyme